MVVGIIIGMAMPRQGLIMVILTADHTCIITDRTITTEATDTITIGISHAVIRTANLGMTIGVEEVGIGGKWFV
jgi:hypothetical protein